MNPFSPLYFIKENKARCLLLMFMIFLSWGVYLGGLYATNPRHNWNTTIHYFEKCAVISPAGTKAEDYKEYKLFCEALQASEKVKILEMGQEGGLNWDTIMGFESGYSSMTFTTVEDFKTFCRYMNIHCDFKNLKSGSIVMSQRFAKNKNLQLGDSIDKDYAETIYDSYTLDALTEDDGYISYFINEKPVEHPPIVVLGDKINGSKLYDFLYEIQKEHNVSVHDLLKTNIDEQFNTFQMIYSFVILFLSFILAITINAAFVGMYQRRHFEFAVYRAIGISKRQIVGKLIGELLCMDFLALFMGGSIFFLCLYLFNNLVLYPDGKYLCYFHPTALWGLLLCNITILFPLIITRCRQMLQADICEY